MPISSRKPLTPDERAARNRQKARDWRAKMRAKGLRPVQVWVHDFKDPGFIEECRRQSRAIANSPTEAEDQAFVDAISIDLDDLP